MPAEFDEDFLKEYQDLLILQYSDREKASNEIRVIVTNAMIQYLFLKSFIDEYDIDEAWGNRLDVLGRVVGVTRIVPNGIVKTFFGFAADPKSRGFSQAPFYNLFRDDGYTDKQLSDPQMRFYIKAKAIKNATSAYILHDFRIDLQDAILFLFDSKAFIVDNYNMSMTIYVENSVPDEKIILLLALNIIPHPQGVRIIIIKYKPKDYFGFAADPNSKGFGQGAFAKIFIL